MPLEVQFLLRQVAAAMETDVNHDKFSSFLQVFHNSKYCLNKAMHGVISLQAVTVKFNIFNQLTDLLHV
jgi:hypothetical protein